MTDLPRDYANEMRAVIDAETAVGPYVSRLAAADIVAKLRHNDPDLLAGWLDGHAEQMVWQAINDRDRSRRTRARATASRSAFADAARLYEERGDSAGLYALLDTAYVVEDGSRRRLAELTSADLAYVADRYDAQARSNAMSAAFLRTLARRIGPGGRVGEHFSEQQIAALWRSTTPSA
jgi:hypothetical protein